MAYNKNNKKDSVSSLVLAQREKGYEYIVLTGVQWDIDIPKEYYRENFDSKLEDIMNDYYENQEYELEDYQEQLDDGLIADESEYVNNQQTNGFLYQEPFELTDEIKNRIDKEVKSEYALSRNLPSRCVLQFKDVANIDVLDQMPADFFIDKVSEQYDGRVKSFDNHISADKSDIMTYLIKQSMQKMANGQDYKNYLKLYSNFLSYSVNNTALVFAQCPNATIVKGYKTWEDMGRHIKNGERAINIYGKAETRTIDDQQKFDEYLQKNAYINDPAHLDERNKYIQEFKDNGKVEIPYSAKTIAIYDVTQTEGKDIEYPEQKKLELDMEHFEEVRDAICDLLQDLKQTKVEFMEDDKCKYSYIESSNVLSVSTSGGTQEQIKNLIEGACDALMHDKEYLLPGIRETAPKDRNFQRLENCSVAFLVMDNYGLSTDYAFHEMMKPFVHSNGKLSPDMNKYDKNFQEFSRVISRTKECANTIEKAIDERLKQMEKEDPVLEEDDLDR